MGNQQIKLTERIEKIGNLIAKCEYTCDGVMHDQKKGILPRGLYLEDGFGSKGVIVCGMNPGSASKDEIRFHKNRAVSYTALLNFWKSVKDSSYFSRMRNLVRALGYDGPILWTNVAKCQKTKKVKRMSFNLSPHTFRFCANNYLKEEIKNLPDSWLLMANGKDAFVALSYLFPLRKLIGFPHTTGAYPQFSKLWLYRKPQELRIEIKEEIERYFEKEKNGALWIKP